MANWKDRAIEVPAEEVKTGSWKDRATVVPDDISKIESGIRGIAQGASFGLSDELTGALESLVSDKSYEQARNESRKAYTQAEKANPKSFLAGQVGGAVGSSFVPGLGGASLGRLATQGAVSGFGASEAEDLAGLAKDTAIGGTIGAATGLAGKALSAGAAKATPYVKSATSALGDFLGEGAEQLAVKATGATGKQAEKFAKGTGRELLDTGVVSFGSTPAKVAERLEAKLGQAGEDISSVLRELDEKGITASVDNVIDVLDNHILELKKSPGNEQLIKNIQKEIDNLYIRGESNIPISAAEQAKRTFAKRANWDNPDIYDKNASANLSKAFREEAEQTVKQASPELFDKFKTGKKTFESLLDVKDAAEARASQLAQSPFGGLGDWTAGAVGGSMGGPIGAAKAVAMKRFVLPRLASSGAVVVDSLAEAVKASPQAFGKFAKPLQDAALRGGNSLASTHFILQQTNPEYQQVISGLQKDEEEE